jgi:hypothetical protein
MIALVRGTDARLGSVEVDVARAGLDLDEDGDGADLDDHVGRREERHRRRQHLVARTDAADAKRDLERAGRRRQHAHRPAAGEIGERRFERLDLGAARDPPRAQHVAHLGDRRLVERGPREGKVRIGAHVFATSQTPRTMKPMPSQRDAVTASPKR